MKEPYREGVATHSDPESCAVAREGGGEALTGARAGRVLSREIVDLLRGADAVAAGGRQHPTHRNREMRRDPARSETPSTHGNTSQGTGRSHARPRLSEPRAASGSPKDVRR